MDFVFRDVKATLHSDERGRAVAFLEASALHTTL